MGPGRLGSSGTLRMFGLRLLRVFGLRLFRVMGLGRLARFGSIFGGGNASYLVGRSCLHSRPRPVRRDQQKECGQEGRHDEGARHPLACLILFHGSSFRLLWRTLPFQTLQTAYRGGFVMGLSGHLCRVVQPLYCPAWWVGSAVSVPCGWSVG